MKGHLVLATLGLACALPACAQQAPASPLKLVAAGSLREALGELAAAYRVNSGTPVDATYGPSGKLREEIAGGRQADVFAAASTAHTEALAAQGLLTRSATFAHNTLCVVSRGELGLNENNLLDILLRPSVRLATSTPVTDPMGDYTWQFFRKADGQQPGSFAVLASKARQLSGAATPAPGSKPPYVRAFEEDQADAYVMYCTNANSTRRALPALSVLRLPDRLNVRSAYGIGARPGSAEGARFVAFVLGEAGRAILRAHGFD